MENGRTKVLKSERKQISIVQIRRHGITSPHQYFMLYCLGKPMGITTETLFSSEV